MKLELARVIAEELKAALAPACTRIEIAGGVRRGKPDPHDLELVVIPDLSSRPRPVFGQPVYRTLLDAALAELMRAGRLNMLKGGERFKQFDVLQHGITLDLFILRPPAQWGVLYTLRTGPAEFSHWCVTPRKQGGALPDYCFVEDLTVWDRRGGEHTIETPEEIDFFKVLGLDWIEPGEREARWNAFVAAPAVAPIVHVPALPKLSTDVVEVMRGIGPGIHITNRVIKID